MFIFGQFSAGYLRINKLYKLSQRMKAMLNTNKPLFLYCNGYYGIVYAIIFSWFFRGAYFKDKRSRKLLHNQRKTKLLTP